jgi:hypothetical protein
MARPILSITLKTGINEQLQIHPLFSEDVRLKRRMKIEKNGKEVREHKAINQTQNKRNHIMRSVTAYILGTPGIFVIYLYLFSHETFPLQCTGIL